MSDRRALSKKTRFEVFKRDLFTCQYCGQKPPAVVLEVDHIVAVVEGGTDDEGNLVTACFDCNRGKGARPLNVSPENLQAKADLILERREQLRAYEELLAQERANLEIRVDDIVTLYDLAFEGWTLKDSARRSIRMFHAYPVDAHRP